MAVGHAGAFDTLEDCQSLGLLTNEDASSLLFYFIEWFILENKRSKISVSPKLNNYTGADLV